MVPPSNVLSAAQPASRNTLSIRELFGSVSAEKTLMPFARATTARCSSSKRREPAALFVVAHGERDLGLVRCDAVVAGDRDESVAQLGDEHDVVVPVDVGDALELRGGRPRDRREEPQVDRFVAQRFVQLDERSFVVGVIGAQVDRAAVGEDDVALPRRVLGHARPNVRDVACHRVGWDACPSVLSPPHASVALPHDDC